MCCAGTFGLWYGLGFDFCKQTLAHFVFSYCYITHICLQLYKAGPSSIRLGSQRADIADSWHGQSHRMVCSSDDYPLYSSTLRWGNTTGGHRLNRPCDGFDFVECQRLRAGLWSEPSQRRPGGLFVNANPDLYYNPIASVPHIFVYSYTKPGRLGHGRNQNGPIQPDTKENWVGELSLKLQQNMARSHLLDWLDSSVMVIRKL